MILLYKSDIVKWGMMCDGRKIKDHLILQKNVYSALRLEEAVYRHYKKYKWVKDLTRGSL